LFCWEYFTYESCFVSSHSWSTGFYIHVISLLNYQKYSPHVIDFVLNLILSGFCDFEKDTCSWQNIQTDDFDWLRHSGKSASASTGPSTDVMKQDKFHSWNISK
jgi:hypothetical protein